MNASLELSLAANQFRALQPIPLWLLVRPITGDEWMLSDEGEGAAMRFKMFMTENKLRERFGIIGEIQVDNPEQGVTNPELKVLQYAVLGIPDVYAMPLSPAQRQSIWVNFSRWKERVGKTLPILRKHGLIEAGNKAIIPFLNLIGSEVKADRKDDFAQWCDDRSGFELDKDKRLVIEFLNVCDDAADLLEKLAIRVAESSATSTPATCQLGDKQGEHDGLFDDDRRLIWGGVRYTLTTNQAIVFRLLVDAYPGDVTHGSFGDKGIGDLRDSFRFNNTERKKRGTAYYLSWHLIVSGSIKDSKRLIDPSIVRSDPKKFSDPQHNPQQSPT